MKENKKEKVGIITINDYTNYGNRLQNYATEQILKSLNFNVETIIKIKENNKESLIDKLKNRTIKQILKHPFKRCEMFFHNYKYGKIKKEKFRTFKEFSNKYLNECKYKIDSSLKNKFDYFVTGSDQVWNPYYNNYPNFEFLTFAKPEQKISFAASFGVSEIPKTHKKYYKNWLNDFSYISVREEAGNKIIKNLTDRKSEVLVDPTMVIAKENWFELAKPSNNKPDNDFLLTYILGDRLLEWDKEIYRISSKYNLEIVNLADVRQPQYFTDGPQEFLDFFQSAKFVFTDSFHGTIFSILFNKPFIVVDRLSSRSMFSRISTLLNKFNFKSRYYNNVNNENVMDIDFSKSNDLLEHERDKSLKFIKDAIEMN